jgi:hypothetical protein
MPAAMALVRCPIGFPESPDKIKCSINGSRLREIILWPGVSHLVAGLEQLNRLAGHDRRYGVLVNELGMPVAAQQYAEIVEPGDDTLQFDAVDQEDRERNLVLTDKIEKSVLKILWPLRSHVPVSYFVLGAVAGALLIKSHWCRLATACLMDRLLDLIQRLQYEAVGKQAR